MDIILVFSVVKNILAFIFSDSDMDLHRRILQSLCRVCHNPLTKEGNKFIRSTKKELYHAALLKAFDINVTEDDEEVHPKEICDTCRCKIHRWWKATQKKRKCPLNLSPVPFLPHTDDCTVCKSSTSTGFDVKHSSFFKSCTESTTVYSKLSHINNVSALSLCVKVYPDFTFSVMVHGKEMPTSSPLFGGLGDKVTRDSLSVLLDRVDDLEVCSGIEGFSELCRSRSPDQPALFKGNDEQITAYEESSYGMQCIRHVKCQLLIEKTKTLKRCDVCTQYRGDVQKYDQRSKNKLDSSHQTFKTMSRKEMEKKLSAMSKEKKNLKQHVETLKKRLDSEIQTKGVLLTQYESALFDDVLDKNSKTLSNMDKTSPMYLLWQQQISAASKKSKKGIRWHPSLIKWCIALYTKSPSTYEMLKKSQFLILPHKNTLRDYIHYTDFSSGLNVDVMNRLKKDVQFESLPSFKRNVTLVFDEMRIKDDLIYNTATGALIGFIEQGSGNDAIDELVNNDAGEPQLATHILALMVRGIFTNMRSVFAYYPCVGFRSEKLYHLIWPAVEFLESAGFYVRALVADGASPNRKFFKLHPGDQNFCITNICDQTRKLYFICDVPHLMKTTRNNWENSHWNKKSRNLHVSYTFSTFPFTLNESESIKLTNSLIGWLVVFNVPSTARSLRDGTPIYCPLRRT